MQQSFTSIREIILNNLGNVFLEKYHYHNLENAKAGRHKDTITQLPRLILELIGITIFLILIIYISYQVGFLEYHIIICIYLKRVENLLPQLTHLL